MADILIIDDDPDVRGTIRKLLERSGHEVREAGDGAVGIREIRRSCPDLVLTDLIMPEKEGIETILELREEYPDLRIIAMSGGGTVAPDGPLSDAEAFGAHASLVKPFSMKVLNETVERVLG